jgi:hypothetical protein
MINFLHVHGAGYGGSDIREELSSVPNHFPSTCDFHILSKYKKEEELRQ